MRKWGLFGLMCLCATAFAQENTLTVTIPGLTVRNAVEQIADLTDTKLEVADSANFNTLVLRLTDVLLDEALEKIAQVTSGEWHDVGGKRVLRVSRDTTRIQELEELEQRRAWIKKALAELRREVEARRAQEDWQLLAMQYAESLRRARQTREYRQQSFDLLDRSPGERLAADVLLAFSVEDLLKVKPGTKQTYSDRQTTVLKQYPRKVGQLLAKYRADLLAWREAVKETTKNFPLNGDSDWRSRLIESRGTPTSLAVNVRSTETGVTLHCLLFNEFGESVGSSDQSLNGELYDAPVKLETEGTVKVPEEAIVASYLTINFRPPGMSDEVVAQWQSRFRQRALNIANEDPVSLAAGPMLVDLAEQNERQLVALLPDDAWLWSRGARVQQREYGVQSLADLVSHDWAMKANDGAGWITASPSRPAAVRKSYLLRKPLQDLVKAVDEHGYVRVEDVVTYVSKQKGESRFALERSVVVHVCKSSGLLRPSLALESVAREMMKVLAAMGPGMQFGTEVQVQPASALGRQVSHWIFTSLNDVFWWQDQQFPDPQTFVSTFRGYRPLALPAGVPQGTTLKLSVEQENATFFRPSPGKGSLKPEGAQDRSVGSYMVQWQRSAAYDAVQFATVNSLKIEITFPGGFRLVHQVQEVPAPKDGAWRTLAQLTQTERSNLERLRDEYLANLGR